MQAIMDEALAQQLYEEECRLLEKEINADQLMDPFVRLQMKEDERYAELVHADMCAGDDDSDDDCSKPSIEQTKLQSAPRQTKAASTRLFAVDKPSYDRTPMIDGGGAGLNSIRERMRRHAKDLKNSQAGRVEGSKHSTRDGVLDERTQLILHKLINKEMLDTVHGCVQAGKEAHVYFAEGHDEHTLQPRPLAVKIFRTTLNEFSNRHVYVVGDHRFDLHFHKKSARRQIALWSEKEYRNLCRAARCTLAVPQPVGFKEHVLVMEFIGKDGWPAPTLKEAKLTYAQLQHAFVDVLLALRTLYVDAKLVHADLSEYNILYHRERCWIIDFGQAIDETHHECEMYLRRDVENVQTFFEKSGLQATTAEEAGILSVEKMIEFITAKDDQARDELIAPFSSLKALVNKMANKRV